MAGRRDSSGTGRAWGGRVERDSASGPPVQRQVQAEVAGPGGGGGTVASGEPVLQALLQLSLLLVVDPQKEVGVHGILLHVVGGGGCATWRPRWRVAPRPAGGTDGPSHTLMIAIGDPRR